MDKLTFGESAEKPTRITEGIFLNGRQVGEIHENTSGNATRFHCVLRIDGELMQGHADTKRESVTAAIFAGRREAERLLSAANKIERELGGAA